MWRLGKPERRPRQQAEQSRRAHGSPGGKSSVSAAEKCTEEQLKHRSIRVEEGKISSWIRRGLELGAWSSLELGLGAWRCMEREPLAVVRAGGSRWSRGQPSGGTERTAKLTSIYQSGGSVAASKNRKESNREQQQGDRECFQGHMGSNMETCSWADPGRDGDNGSQWMCPKTQIRGPMGCAPMSAAHYILISAMGQQCAVGQHCVARLQGNTISWCSQLPKRSQ
ncbi:unnamed protein product [Calypogeia fissa]